MENPVKNEAAPSAKTGGSDLPQDVARAVTEYLPLTAAVNLVRPLFLGYAPSNIAVYLAVLVLTSLVTFGIATHLVRRRFAQ